MIMKYRYLLLPVILLLGACSEQANQQTATAPASTPAPVVASAPQPAAAPVTLGSVAPAESANKQFKGSITSSLNPVVINEMHNWTLHLTTTDGQPVEQATMTITGAMPAHAHGMPTNPQMTRNLGGGDYLIEGVQFQMGGYWEVKFTITAGSQLDDLLFGITLQ